MFPFRSPSSDPLIMPPLPDRNHDFGLFWGLGVILFLGVAAAGIAQMITHQRYVESGQASTDAMEHGCASGVAESAQCRSCASQNGVCCDLRCKGPNSEGHDVRLRCSPNDGCMVAPEVEVNVTHYGDTSSTTSPFSTSTVVR